MLNMFISAVVVEMLIMIVSILIGKIEYNTLVKNGISSSDAREQIWNDVFYFEIFLNIAIIAISLIIYGIR